MKSSMTVKDNIKLRIFKGKLTAAICCPEINAHRQKRLLTQLHIRWTGLRGTDIRTRMPERKQKFTAACVNIQYLHIWFEIMKNRAAVIPWQIRFHRVSSINMRKIPSLDLRSFLFCSPQRNQIHLSS